MKKIITNKNFIQKILISIIVVLLLNFAVPIQSRASIGGILLDPFFDFFGTLGDALVGGLQMFLVDGEMNNSDDSGDGIGGALNMFMVTPDAFNENAEGKYNEFQPGGGEATESISEDELETEYYIPVLKYTPEKIFSNLIPALDINFVSPKNWEDSEMNERSVALTLHQTIASWYVALRNLAIVGLMLVLVYVGIRIVISSTAGDKSKYKQMLMDWLIALCLLFSLHYIMSFTSTIVSEVSRAIAGTPEDGSGNNITVTVEGTDVSFNTDLMGLIRFKMQAPDVGTKLLYLVLYGAMVIYTVLFTFTYLKRVLTMAFLTLIAPMVALTYPIDKMNDGKAQAFNMWFKEYVFNALVQPFHLIIYTVFVGSAVQLAATNPLFAIVTLAFLTPAEKLLRKFFGFEKASTGGALGSFAKIAGGGAVMNMLKGASGRGHKAGGATGSKPPRTARQRVEGDLPSISGAASGLGDTIRTAGNETGDEHAEPDVVINTDGSLDERHLIRNAGSDGGVQTGGTADGGLQTGELGRDGNGDIHSSITDGDNYNRTSAGGIILPDRDIRLKEDEETQEPPSEQDEQADEQGSGQDNGNGPQVHGEGRPGQWTDNDTRTARQYIGDVAKGVGRAGIRWAGSNIAAPAAKKVSAGAKKVGGMVGSTAVGSRAIELGRKAKGTAHAMSEYQNRRRAQSRIQMEKDIERIPKPIRNGVKATGAAIGRTAANVGRGVANVAVKGGVAAAKGAVTGTLRGATSIAGTVVRSAPGAIVGTMAGIASDDLGDIFKYAAAGAAITNTALSGSGQRVGSFVAEAYREGARGSDSAKIAQRQKEYVKNTEWDDVYQHEFMHDDGSKLSRSELKAKKQQGAYFDSLGFEGKDSIKAIKVQEKLKKELESQGMQEDDATRRAQILAANAMKEVKGYEAKDLRDEKTMKDLRKSLTQKFAKQGLDKKDVQSTVEMVVKGMKKARGVENDL